ncbi:hypothetical protein ACFSO7_01875 [Bacillus sp. CGMCC 1.16607]|uniref:hypothetical protein n=1 Tax=Bacillus sp. CGMCC 1.16607 TaxID=3351842 RepID=UPI00362757B2
MKKLNIIVLFLLIAILMLGCNAKKEESPSPIPEKTAPKEELPKFQNTGTFNDVLTFRYPNGFNWDKDNSLLLSENEENPLFKVWFIETESEANNLSEIQTEFHTMMEEEGDSELIEEKFTEINGKEFYYAKEFSTFETRSYIIGLFTIHNGKQYIMFGYVKDTEKYEEGLKLLEDIYQTVQF